MNGETFTASSLAVLQLEDARRACLAAAGALHCVAGNAADHALRAHVERLHAALRAHIDELASMSQRTKVGA